MIRTIIDFHQDDEQHWVASLSCGHNQHMRHNPPLVTRPWVLTEEGRRQKVGAEIACILCDEESATIPHHFVPHSDESDK